MSVIHFTLADRGNLNPKEIPAYSSQTNHERNPCCLLFYPTPNSSFPFPLSFDSFEHSHFHIFLFQKKRGDGESETMLPLQQ